MIDTSRRSFLRAALFVAAAPIIVRASSLMPVRALREYDVADFIVPDTEFVTEISLCRGIERYSFGIAEWRSAFGPGGVLNELPRL